MLRAPLRRTPRLLANASARAVKPRVPRRFASSDSHHGSAKHGSDLPWLIPSVGITVPLCFWLWSTTPKMEEDHRWERRAARVAAKKKEEEEHAKQQEEQARAEEEKKNVEGGDETTEGGEESNPSDETSPDEQAAGHGATEVKQEGLSNAPTKKPRDTAAKGKAGGEAEPSAKDTKTVQPEHSSTEKNPGPRG